MHVFQIKGFQGLLMFGLALIGIALLVFAIPSAFMMVLWNATVFEGLHGPEIGFLQGLVLWLIALVLFKLIFKPEIELHMSNVSDSPDLEQQLKEWTQKQKDKKEPK